LSSVVNLEVEAYGGDELWAAEASARGNGPVDALMQRAAAGLAVARVRLLRERYGRVSGAKAVVLVGPGDNGGDGLLAGARLRARGVSVDAILVAPSAFGPGVDALIAAGPAGFLTPRPLRELGVPGGRWRRRICWSTRSSAFAGTPV
jgi:hypothetical protein